jgi:hypothetical protein
MATATPTKKRLSAAEKAALSEQTAGAILGVKPIGKIIDSMHALRERKRALDEELKKLDAEYREEETLLMERMTAEGTDKGSGKLASASITTGVIADVQDWAEVEKFVKRTGNFQLFQRRVSDAAFRELLETKGSVPGIKSFTKRRVNLRAISST